MSAGMEAASIHVYTSRVSGADVHVYSEGSGPDVVLLHGVPEDPQDLERLAAALPGFRAHVVHAPGYGRSAEVPARGLSTLRVARALRERGVTRAHWVGMSAGFYRAMTLVKDAGFEAASFVGIGPAVDLTPDKRESLVGFAAALEAGADLGAAALQVLYEPAFLAEHPEVEARFLRMLAAVPTAALVEELRALAEAPDLGGWLREAGVPTVLRVGERDQAGLRDGLEDLARAPHIALEWAPGAGHMLLDEDFEATADSARRALS